MRKPTSLASQGVSSLGEPASRRCSPFYCGSSHGPDELSSFYFVVVHITQRFLFQKVPKPYLIVISRVTSSEKQIPRNYWNH